MSVPGQLDVSCKHCILRPGANHAQQHDGEQPSVLDASALVAIFQNNIPTDRLTWFVELLLP
jgi:hypothetical protein